MKIAAFALAAVGVLMLAGCGPAPTPAPEVVVPVPEQSTAVTDCNQVFTEECAERARERNRRARGNWDSVRSDAGRAPAEQPQKNDDN